VPKSCCSFHSAERSTFVLLVLGQPQIDAVNEVVELSWRAIWGQEAQEALRACRVQLLIQRACAPVIPTVARPMFTGSQHEMT
jgi:hypothetical protein